MLCCLTADMEVDDEAREDLLTRYRAHGRKGGAADQARPATARRSTSSLPYAQSTIIL